TQLNISYSTLRRILVREDLHKLCDIKSQHQKGGRKRSTNKDKFGYLYADPSYDYIDENGDKRRQYEHVVIAEQKLGRPLNKNEVVHHINLDKEDNRPENLFICSNKDHRKIHHDLEHLAVRLVQSGQIDFVPELQQYI